jgi:hypothetical protein
VATYSTGIAATWGSVAFTEVVDLSWTYGGENVLRGAGLFNFSHGSVSMVTLGATPTIANIGQRNTLTITGGGVGLTIKALLKSVGASAEVNGVTRTAVEFDIFED